MAPMMLNIGKTHRELIHLERGGKESLQVAKHKERYGGFQKWVAFWGVSIIRIIVSGGVYIGVALFWETTI